MANPSSIKRIGLLTGGGDCPGLNAVIRAVSKSAMFRHDIEVVGILNGFEGLIRNQVRRLDARDVSGILTRGGTILGSNNRISPLHFPSKAEDGSTIFIEATDRCLDTIEEHALDALIVIGGDGTMACTIPIVDAGIPCLGVPKTIDNDIIGTDLTFGYTTAMTTATHSLDRLHTTADSHHRVMVCELMGRNSGWLTLSAGIASGSDVILIPEIPFSIDRICEYLQGRMESPAGFSIIACAEGAHQAGGPQIVSQVVEGSPDPNRLGGIGQLVAAAIEERTAFETRTTVLGHVQRGGPPVAMDRVLATRFGVAALELLVEGHVNRMVVWRNGEIDHVDIHEVATGQRLVPLDHPMIDAARAVNTCFGRGN
ncbi:MAG: 6-phosphofructokinase [Phycisphaerae bacterium]|nr:6-phosphofructokinase [Phycisphaerae bacterium]MDG1898624.1 ATP-dependent 6-phosphofructokinase [Phycisphaerales bacterium]|tara:strand:+ start:3987 stop:5096 length:1110 start_codon:yes stop_codon:yes gene_type:complete